MVLRFSNRDIWERFEGIKMQIDEEVKKRWHPPTTASRSPAPQGADKDRCFDGSLKSRSVAVNEVEGGIHDGKN